MIKNKINIEMVIKLLVIIILLTIFTILIINKTFIKDNYKNIKIPRFSYFINDKKEELELITIKSYKALKNYYDIENVKEFTLYTCNNHQLYFNMKFKYSFEDYNKFCDNLN